MTMPMRAALPVDVDAEAPDACRGVRRVVLAERRDLGLHLRVLDDDARDVLGVLRLQRLGAEEHEVAAHARRRRDADLEMDVARLGGHGLRQELVDVAFVAVHARLRRRGVRHLVRTRYPRSCATGQTSRVVSPPTSGPSVSVEIGRKLLLGTRHHPQRPQREDASFARTRRIAGERRPSFSQPSRSSASSSTSSERRGRAPSSTADSSAIRASSSSVPVAGPGQVRQLRPAARIGHRTKRGRRAAPARRHASTRPAAPSWVASVARSST